MDVFLPLLLQFILILLNAVFACAEIAVLSVNEAKLAQLKEQGNKRAKRLEKLTADSSKFLATIQVAITLAGFLGSAFAADNFADDMARGLAKLGMSLSVSALRRISVVLITVILSFITLVFGELVPKRLAMKKAEKMALGLSGLLRFVSKIFAPIVWLLTVSTNGVLRLMGIDPKDIEEAASEDDIKLMVDESTRQGLIDSDEKEIIHNLFEFDDLSVGEFATHRTDVAFLWEEDSVEVWDETIIEHRHSYYPLCGETADEIKGVLCAKDYFAIKEKTKASVMEKAVRPAHFVPEGMRADVLFKQMKKIRNHFSVVLDEYGGFAGIVTMNDLLAQIVGDFDDSTDEEDIVPDIVSLSEDTWQIKGVAMLDEVAEELGVSFPDEGDYDTLGGYAFALFGGIPEDGTTFTAEDDNIIIKGERVDNHRLEMATVIKKLKEDEEDKADEEE
ncbi:MAG: HlyC/CorC family transporter [Clostridia bacterium]|nr:HlyC/CorC family transporter [Clostridia bacterium]